MVDEGDKYMSDNLDQHHCVIRNCNQCETYKTNLSNLKIKIENELMASRGNLTKEYALQWVLDLPELSL